MGKTKIAVLFSITISLVLVLSLLWPSAYIYSEWVWECSPYTITVESVDNAGQKVITTSTGQACGWSLYWYSVTYSGGGGVPPDEGGVPSSGGGGTVPPGGSVPTNNPRDTDNNGYIDCWKNVMIELDGIQATSWGEYRGVDAQGVAQYHWAIDFNKPKANITGLDINSVSNGTVYAVAPNSNSDGGWWISIKSSDGAIWTYCHMQSATTLKPGETVIAGSTIVGQVDSTGTNCQGAHLHLQCKSANGQWVNPLDKIQTGNC